MVKMLPALALRGDRVGTWSQQSVELAMTEWNRRSPVQLPYHASPEGLVIAADMRLEYLPDLLATLPGRETSLHGSSDIELLAAAYRAWGTACVHHLEGEYAFVMWDAQQHRLFGARSRTGQRPFVFYRGAQTFLCASEVSVLLASEMIEKRLHGDWLSSWLVEGHDAWDCTAIEKIEKLPAGHTITIDEQGVCMEAFWNPSSPRRSAWMHQQECTEQFRSLLCAAVRSRLRSSTSCLVDISGGLDSSSLACMAGHLQQQGTALPRMQGVHAFAPSSPENDDRHLASLVAQATAMPVSYLSYDDFPPFRDVFLPQPWTDTPAPPLLWYGAFYTHLFQLARDQQIHTHMRGDFGDQLFDVSPRYVRQLAAEHHYLRLLQEMWSWQRRNAASASSVLLACLPSRRDNRPSLHACMPWVREAVVNRGIERKLAEDNRGRQVCPDPVVRQLYHAVLHHDDYLATQNSSTKAGLETLEPFLDERILFFLSSIAPQNHIRFGGQKFLLREAMRGVLPEAIRTRRSKGRIARLLFAGIARHHQRLRDLILAMPEELEPFVDAARLAQALDVAASGGTLDQVSFLSALALVLWAHRLPWCQGRLPHQEQVIYTQPERR